MLISRNSKDEQNSIWVFIKVQDAFTLTKNEGIWSQGRKPCYTEEVCRAKQQYCLLCKSIISAVLKKYIVHYFCCLKNIYFPSTHISRLFFFFTVFSTLLLLAFHYTSQLEINSVRLVANLQVTLEVISTAIIPWAFKKHSREVENCQELQKMLQKNYKKPHNSLKK